jgi:hypothetical protein
MGRLRTSQPGLWLLLTCTVGVLAATGFVLLMHEAGKPRDRAEQLVRDLASLRVGKSSFDDAERIAAKHGGRQVASSGPCTEEYCELSFSIESALLPRLLLARPTVFSAAVFVGKGKVRQLAFGLTRGGSDPDRFCAVHVTEFQDGPEAAEEYKPFSITRRTGVGGRHQTLNVRLTEQASPSDRALAYSLQLSCLNKLGGCADASELAPRLWPPSVKGD